MLTEVKLEKLRHAARTDSVLRQTLLETETQPESLSRFCAVSTEYGIPLTAMEMITYGEESYAAMRRSTNGGGENSPLLEWEDDYYELFLAGLKEL